ncbi:MAG: hypothetical protein WDN06_21980 [Asticcacaulis sp.]
MFDLARTTTPDTRTLRARRTRQAKSEIAAATYDEFDGIGMGTLSTGEPYLTQRGLAALCGVQNAHIGTISRDWATDKPRIAAVKARLGFKRGAAHRVLIFEGRRLYAYDMAIACAVLDYYALDAGNHIQPEAVRNRVRFGDGGLKAHILDQFATPQAQAEPIRFVPTEADEPEDVNAVAAFLMRIWSLYALSFWMAVNHIEELRQQWARAPWNRLGLYLPLKAVLEIQAEIVRRNTTLGFR